MYPTTNPDQKKWILEGQAIINHADRSKCLAISPKGDDTVNVPKYDALNDQHWEIEDL